MYNNNLSKLPGKWISRLYRGFITFQKWETDIPGAGYGQIPILMGLSVHEGISQDELARHIQVDRTTLNRTIRPLIKNGYVESRPNPDDRRANIVTLTTRGEEIVPEIRESLIRWNRILLQNFTEEEREQFNSLLIKAAGNIQEYYKKGYR